MEQYDDRRRNDIYYSVEQSPYMDLNSNSPGECGWFLADLSFRAADL